MSPLDHRAPFVREHNSRLAIAATSRVIEIVNAAIIRRGVTKLLFHQRQIMHHILFKSQSGIDRLQKASFLDYINLKPAGRDDIG